MSKNLGFKFLDYKRLEEPKNNILYKLIFHMNFPYYTMDMNNIKVLSNLPKNNPSNILVYSLSEYKFKEYVVNGETFLEYFVSNQKKSINISKLNIVEKSANNSMFEIYSTDIKFIWKKLYQSYIKSLKISKTKLSIFENLRDKNNLTDYLSIGKNLDIEYSQNEDLYKFKFEKISFSFFDKIISNLFDNDLSLSAKKRKSVFQRKLEKYEKKLNEVISKENLTLTYFKWSSKDKNNMTYIPTKKLIYFDSIKFKNGYLICEYTNSFTLKKMSKTFLCNYAFGTKKEFENSLFFDIVENTPTCKSSDTDENITIECLVFNFEKIKEVEKEKIFKDLESKLLEEYNKKIERFKNEIKILTYDIEFYKKYR